MTDTSAPTSLLAALIVAITVLAAVITFLFFFYQKKLDGHGKQEKEEAIERVKERSEWSVERVRFERIEVDLRAEYEAKYRRLAEDHAKQLAQVLEDARIHEDTIRREFAENMELVASKAAES